MSTYKFVPYKSVQVYTCYTTLLFSKKYVQICTSMYIRPYFLFPKNMYKSVQVYTYCTTLFISKKYGTGRHVGGSSKWLRVGQKWKWIFPYSFSRSKLCNFLFSAICCQLKFFRNFFCSCEFLQENIMKIRFVCEQEHGKEKSHYISNTFSLALSFPLYIIEGFW